MEIKIKTLDRSVNAINPKNITPVSIFDLELIYTTNEHDYYDCVDEEYCNYCRYCYWGYDKYIKHSYLMSYRDKAEWFLSK